MYTFFLACAVFGGTLLALQLAMAFFGLGSDALGGDFGDIDSLGQAGSHDVLGHHGHVPAHHAGDAGADGTATGDHAVADHQHNPKVFKLGKFITIQTVVAFLTFFGLGGMATIQMDQSTPVAALVASVAGFMAMYGLGHLLASLSRLDVSGTVRIENSIGGRGRVYLRIPEKDSGVGKVTVVIQGRTVELKAKTPGPELKTGALVEVADVIGEDTVEVVAVEEAPVPDVARQTA